MRVLVGDAYALLFGWPALSKLNKGLFYLAARALGLHNYASDRLSGEAGAVTHLLRRVARPVVFDVGANSGDWAAMVARLAPTSEIHAFEPQARLAEQLFARLPGVTVNSVAVGDQAGSLTLYDYADRPGSQHASLVPGVIDRVHRATPQESTVPVTTLDIYCAERGVASIDLLKIDVEGFELNVLRGAERLLREGRVSAIQFEFNEMNVVGRTFVADFMNLLKRDYQFHRALPHGLLALGEGNHWFNEQFIFQNIIATRRHT